MTTVEDNADNIINIMLSSDNHLGYYENDQIRGNDSFVAFEEMLMLAKEHDVDLILLGGDLFHDSKPSPNCLLRCTALLRKYCFGDKPVAIEILSDQSKNFHEAVNETVNYEDPNLNISHPVFSIHGNHDDPIGQYGVSSLDILATAGLVNYFGKWSDSNKIIVSPILIRKGETNLALYGLSHLKDQRFARLFRDCKIEMEKVDDGSEWFNLLTLHQNRADRKVMSDNYIPEEALPDFLDLIVWGHEHECRIQEEWNGGKKFYVTQPGSTVATSLAVGEAVPKHCALLQICKKKFKLSPLKLETVRLFIFKCIVLSEENLGPPTINEDEKVQKFLVKKVEDLLVEADNLRSGNPKQPELPLLRLSVFYEDDSQDFNRIRFGQQFSNRVANPHDILLMKREKRIKDRKVDPGKLDAEALEDVVRQANDELSVEGLLETYYENQPTDKQLSLLSVKAIGEAIKDYTLKGNDDVFRKIILMHKEQYMEFLQKSNAETKDEVAEQISIYKRELDSKDNNQYKTVLESTLSVDKTAVTSMSLDIHNWSDDDGDSSSPTKKLQDTKAPTSGRGRGRGARGARGSRGGRGSTTSQAKLDVSVNTKPSKSKANTSQSTAAASGNWLSNVVSSRSRKQPSQSSRTSTITIDDSD